MSSGWHPIKFPWFYRRPIHQLMVCTISRHRLAKQSCHKLSLLGRYSRNFDAVTSLSRCCYLQPQHLKILIWCFVLKASTCIRFVTGNFLPFFTTFVDRTKMKSIIIIVVSSSSSSSIFYVSLATIKETRFTIKIISLSSCTFCA